MDARSAPAEESLASLAHRIRAGEGSAEEHLVLRFQRGLTLSLRRRCGDASLAEDLAQDTLLVTLEKVRRGEVEEPERLAGFIHATARNLLAAHRRKHRRWVPLLESAEDRQRAPQPPGTRAQHPPAPLDELLREEEARLVRKLLGEMRVERDRELLTRYYLSQEEKEALCSDLGIDDGHLRRVLFRARSRLKELWEQAQRRGDLQGVLRDTRRPADTKTMRRPKPETRS